jgi:pilus assembly protein CpaB
MNLNLPKGVLYVGCAVMAGLVATFAIHKYISAKTKVATVSTRPVLVATADISAGTAITGQSVKTVPWPQELVPPTAALSLKGLEGRVLAVPVVKGEAILLPKLAPEGAAAGLSGLLGENKRALTVRVDDVSGVAGFIHPGDHVDILAEMKIPKSDDNISKTILQNIVVLTTGQIWEQKGENKPVVVNTVTLELTPDQAEVLNLATNVGKIRLSLRNRSNTAAVPTKGVAASHLTNVDVANAGVSKKEGGAAARLATGDRTVQVIRRLKWAAIEPLENFLSKEDLGATAKQREKGSVPEEQDRSVAQARVIP